MNVRKKEPLERTSFASRIDTCVATYNILLYRTCVHTLHYSRDECSGFLSADSSNETQAFEGEVQQYVTRVQMVRMIIEALVPAFLSLFIGAWSGVHGRKPLIVWPLYGQIAASVLIAGYSLLDGLGPWWFVGAALPFSLTGGYSILATGAYCHLSDNIDERRRSLRMMLLDAVLAGAIVLGSVVSPSVVRALGNTYLLVIVAVLYLIALLYSIFYVTESLPGATKGGLKSMFKFDHVKEMAHNLVKRRPDNVRGQIFLLASAYTLVQFIDKGITNFGYLYTRQKLNWAMSDYSLYTGLSTFIAFLGGFVGVICLQIILGMSDMVIALMALVSAMGDTLTKALAVSTWHMYLAAAIALLKGLAAPLMRSHLSKILPIEDTAKAFSVLCALEALCPIAAPPVYTALYNATLHAFTGAIYILSTCINLLCVVLVGCVQCIL